MRSAYELIRTISAVTHRDRALIAAHRGGSMGTADGQLDALVDICGRLDAAGIRYALIGGIAVGIQSSTPRATEDIDVAVATVHSRQDVITVLEQAGFHVTGSFEHSVNLRHPAGEPVQVAFDPVFDPMVARAEALDVAGTTIYVLTKDDLIASKERAASDPRRRCSKALRDRADVELLRGEASSEEDGW